MYGEWGDGTRRQCREGTRYSGQRRVKHTVTPVSLGDINDKLDELGRGHVIGRAVVVFD
jgi:D-arabinose 1-dehydrogenase-like Zn-dependent alcohol dehydrogenase